MTDEAAKQPNPKSTALPMLALATLGLFCFGQPAFAEDAAPAPSFDAAPAELGALSEGTAMVMLDYEKIALTTGGKFDFLSTHYLQQINDWIYVGAGISAPLVNGNFGGFFSGDLTLHTQKEVFGNWFVDAGLSVGAGAGGASVRNILSLSGTGAYVKGYAGFGYGFGNLNVGVNLARVQIAGSPINDTTLNFFIQKPLSYRVGSHSASGDALGPEDFAGLGTESIVSFEYSNLNQINPTGKYKGDIGLVSPQFLQFIDADNYVFYGLDLGVTGLVWYNQFQGGVGRRVSVGPRINLYGQLGIGSGGWVTDTINTGPGLVFYPKAKAEYMWSNGVGTFFSAGYMIAPKGTSRNWSIGAGVQYHFPSAKQVLDNQDPDTGVALRGLRISAFDRKSFGVVYNGTKLHDLNLVGGQFDYNLTKHWYFAVQVAAATNDFKGYAGYVEGLAGVGYQMDLFGSDRLQGYAQVLYGLNDVGITAQHDVGALIYPSFGVNYNLTDRYSIYTQFGKTISTGQYIKRGFTNAYESYSVGVGVSFRFGVPIWTSK